MESRECESAPRSLIADIGHADTIIALTAAQSGAEILPSLFNRITVSNKDGSMLVEAFFP